MVKVSVIIPVYNRTLQLKSAVDSVLAQTFKDIEVLVIDDGSTVDIGPFVAADPRVKIVRQKNRGVSAARNAGIKLARGKYIALLDSDDAWLPEKLIKQVKYMDEHPELLISQTEDIWFRHGQRVNPHNKHQKKAGDIFIDSLELCLISPSAVIMRRELFDKVGLFDETLLACEDYDLWLRVTSRYPVGLLPEQLIVRYAGHPDQLSVKYWGLDRFRVRSLTKILRMELSAEQREALKKVLKQKLNILMTGAGKRGRLFTWLSYRCMLWIYFPGSK